MQFQVIQAFGGPDRAGVPLFVTIPKPPADMLTGIIAGIMAVRKQSTQAVNREAVHYWKPGTQLFRPTAVKGRLAYEEEASQGC